MRFSLTQLSAAALVCALGQHLPTHAAPITVNAGAAFTLNNGSVQVNQVFNAGTQQLAFSNGFYATTGLPDDVGGAIGLFNNLWHVPFVGDGISESFVMNDLGENVRGTLHYSRPTNSLVLDDATGQIQTLHTNGTISVNAPQVSGTQTGGTLVISNLRVDLPGKTVMADLAGTKLAAGTKPAVVYNSPNTVLWTFTSTNANGPTALEPADWASANPAAALIARGFDINSNGRLVARHTFNNLQITPTGWQFITNAVGGLSLYLGQDGYINTRHGWGTLTLVTEFGTVSGGGGSGGITGAGITLPTGQLVATGLTLPGGVPLRLQHVSTSSSLNYNPLTYDTAAPALTEQGLLPWLNVFGVTPVGAGLSLGYNATVQDPRFASGDDNGATRYRIRITSSGTTLTLHTGSGAITSLGGFNHDMTAPFLNSALGGGTWRARDIRYLMSTQTAYANLSGTQAGVGNGNAQAISNQNDAPLWSYGTLSGPSTLPLAALAAATSASALPGILQSAGFTVNSVTSSAITFSGVYVFGGLNMAESMKEYTCLALACTQVARRALLTPETSYLGDFRATVSFTLPLTP